MAYSGNQAADLYEEQLERADQMASQIEALNAPYYQDRLNQVTSHMFTRKDYISDAFIGAQEEALIRSEILIGDDCQLGMVIKGLVNAHLKNQAEHVVGYAPDRMNLEEYEEYVMRHDLPFIGVNQL